MKRSWEDDKGEKGAGNGSHQVGNQLRSDGQEWIGIHERNISSSVEESGKSLQTDRIDLQQLHGGKMEDPIDGTIGASELLQQQSKMIHYAISSIRMRRRRHSIRPAEASRYQRGGRVSRAGIIG